MNLKTKNREKQIAEKHLSHCRYMAKKQPDNKYWKIQIEKTERLLKL